MRAMASCTRRSGSFSRRSPAFMKPTGAATINSPPRRLLARRERTLPEKIEFVFVETALEAEQQTVDPHAVVHRPFPDRSVRYQQRGTSHQLPPVAAVAGKARDLPRRHGPDLAQADLRNHPLETGADNASAERPNRHHRSFPDQPSADRRSRIAYCSALLSRLCKPVGRGSPDVQDRLTFQVMRPIFELMRISLVSVAAILTTVIEDQTHHQLRQRRTGLWWERLPCGRLSCAAAAGPP